MPDLSIDRSAVGAVFIRFVEDQHWSWGDSVYDGGSVLKSWIKDKNTIVIEKQPWFDANGPLIIYILTLYPQLNQGANTIKGTPSVSDTRPLWWCSNTGRSSTC